MSHENHKINKAPKKGRPRIQFASCKQLTASKVSVNPDDLRTGYRYSQLEFLKDAVINCFSDILKVAKNLAGRERHVIIL